VDRNHIEAVRVRAVARRLLHEGVDRNPDWRTKLAQETRRLLHGGVDRNCVRPAPCSQSASRLLHGAVDRNYAGMEKVWAELKSPPSRGANRTLGQLQGPSESILAMNRFRVAKGSESRLRAGLAVARQTSGQVPGFVEFHLLAGLLGGFFLCRSFGSGLRFRK
jgi:hypothetical protein